MIKDDEHPTLSNIIPVDRQTLSVTLTVGQCNDDALQYDIHPAVAAAAAAARWLCNAA